MKSRLMCAVGLCFLLAGTAQGSSTLIFPRLSFAPQDLTGIAIVNPGDETASVTFTAYGVDGLELAGEGSSQTADSEGGPGPQGAFTNPVSFDILAGQQFAQVTSSIFGSGIDPEAIGWVEAGVYRSFCNFGKGELKDQRSGAGFLQKLKARARRIRMAPDPKDRLPRELLKELIEEGSEAFRGVLEKLFNTAMQMEREEFLGARRWERSEQRRDHANGYKDKTLSTRVGQLRIRIPQVRHLDFYPRSLERGCRSEKALKLAIAEMYVMGVSTRKVTEITEQLCGTEISASQVSRISKLLDDELEQFRNRPLGSYPVVYLDAHYEKVRRQGSIQDVAVLKATGVNCWGKREVIGISCRLSEAEVHWREFLQQLQKRGLEGVQLIVSDDHSGLRAARRAVFPSVPWQRCQFHLSQNAQRYARRSDQRAAIATDIRDIFNAPSGGEAEAMLRTRVEQYRDRNPELADWMETNLPEGFTVFRFARSTWRRIRTNNGLENLNRQIRRRTRVVGIFPNTESALRLITAVVEEIHEDWLIGKQYLSLVDFNPQENPVSDRSQSNYRKTVA